MLLVNRDKLQSHKHTGENFLLLVSEKPTEGDGGTSETDKGMEGPKKKEGTNDMTWSSIIISNFELNFTIFSDKWRNLSKSNGIV
jgi:hypothetical protein